MVQSGWARWLWWGAALVAVLLGAWQRSVAVQKLPPDFDELVYIPAAFDYAERMTPGRWGEIPDYAVNYEHPPMVKLMFATEVKLAGTPRPIFEDDAVRVGTPLAEDHQATPAFRITRWLSWTFGVVQLAVLAALNPLGALVLDFSSYHAKYTSQAYLEAVPGLFAILAVLFFERATRNRGAYVSGSPELQRSKAWLAASAIALGLAAAGKYPFGLVVALTLGVFLILRYPGRPLVWVGFVLGTIAVFFVAQPYLWPAPVERVVQSAGFHWGYSQSEHVKNSGLPWYQPLYWLTHSEPTKWHQGIFLTPLADWVLFPLAVLGWWPTVKRRPIWAAWAAIGLVFLLLWPTKWPQYILLILAPLALCAGNALAVGVDFLAGRVRGRRPGSPTLAG